MEKLIIRLIPRIPELFSRALAGDPSAIALLTVMGVGAVITNFKKNS